MDGNLSFAVCLNGYDLRNALLRFRADAAMICPNSVDQWVLQTWRDRRGRYVCCADEPFLLCHYY